MPVRMGFVVGSFNIVAVHTVEPEGIQDQKLGGKGEKTLKGGGAWILGRRVAKRRGGTPRATEKASFPWHVMGTR